jgi:hypothetical protein
MTTTPCMPLPTENVAGIRIAAAKVRSTPSGSSLRWFATWRGPSVAMIVTVVSSRE